MQLSPVPGCTGIELLQADSFDLYCFQTLTGTKFLAVTEPQTPDVDSLLRYTSVLAVSVLFCPHAVICNLQFSSKSIELLLSEMPVLRKGPAAHAGDPDCNLARCWEVHAHLLGLCCVQLSYDKGVHAQRGMSLQDL